MNLDWLKWIIHVALASMTLLGLLADGRKRGWM